VKFMKFNCEKFDLYFYENKIKAYQLAEKSGVSASQISLFRKGKSIPQPHTLKKICDALNVSIKQFCDFEEDFVKITNDDQAIDYLLSISTDRLDKIVYIVQKVVAHRMDYPRDAEKSGDSEAKPLSKSG